MTWVKPCSHDDTLSNCTHNGSGLMFNLHAQQTVIISMDPRQLFIKDFSYTLPEEKIAAFPLPERDLSRLLIYNKRSISEDIYRNIASHLPEEALLVFNNTRVVEARIIFQKPTGGLIEIFALEPGEQYPDVSMAMRSTGRVWWKCLIGGAGKWKHGQVLQKTIVKKEVDVVLTARIVDRGSDSFTIEFSWNPEWLNFAEILHDFGAIPIPPYLKRDTEAVDLERYQTVYAREGGSVAAPTAGLHFTAELFETLAARSIETEFITLHVGAGTFMPVKTDTISGHNMHAEYLQVEKKFIRKLADRRSEIFAVGTTSLRTLESLYWMGVKCTLDPFISRDDLQVKQWEPYEFHANINPGRGEALNALVSWMENNELEVLVIKTSILIAPPYRAKTVKGLITNFHQPASTLLLLVAALIGNEWRRVYDYALQHDFRFLSYGDGCLLYVDE
jgi:S-adenosylmethionine:tRNA ribosyltransferase-isomerase